MFEQVVEEATKILSEDLGIELETDSCRLYSTEEWEAFQEKRGFKHKQGVFKPGSMTAHVHSEGDLSTLLLHEHIAHRVFFENAVLGLEIRKKEDELSKLESILIGDELVNQDANLKFVKDTSTENYSVEKDNGDYVIRFNPSDVLINAYFNLAKETLKLRRNNEALAEGFADWMTDYLSRRINGVALIETETKNPVLRKLLEIEHEKGPISAFYSVNTKRSHKPELLIKLLKEMLGEDYDKVTHIFKYGSDKPFSDIDFLAIVESKEEADKLISLNLPQYLDITFETREDFMNGLYVKDIHFTIPFIDGLVLKGEVPSEFSDQLEAKCTKDEFMEHMVKQKKKALTYSKKCYDQFVLQRRHSPKTAMLNLYRALINLSYAGMYNIQINNYPAEAANQDYFNNKLNDNSVFSQARKLLKNMVKIHPIKIERKFHELYRMISV